MLKKLSKLGLAFTFLYWAGSIFTWVFVRYCTQSHCGLLIIIPFLPWMLILEPFIPSELAFHALALFAIVNTILAYFFGKTVSWFFRRLFSLIKKES